MKLYILPYKMASASAKLLSQKIGGVVRIRPDSSSRFKGSKEKVVINWGNSSMPKHVEDCIIINHPDNVNIAANKLSAFEVLKDTPGVTIPDFTTSKEVAAAWIDGGREVVCRTVLRGHSGEGIVIASTKEELVDAPLYTAYCKKKTEYRVHYANGGILSIARKARKFEVKDEDVNWKIRNLAGGFVYTRDGVNAPDVVYGMADNTINALGLDFGAVDIIWNEKYGKATVLEVNCAPGLEDRTASEYANGLYGIFADHIRQEQRRQRLLEGVPRMGRPVPIAAIRQEARIRTRPVEIDFDIDALVEGDND